MVLDFLLTQSLKLSFFLEQGCKVPEHCEIVLFHFVLHFRWLYFTIPYSLPTFAVIDHEYHLQFVGWHLRANKTLPMCRQVKCIFDQRLSIFDRPNADFRLVLHKTSVPDQRFVTTGKHLQKVPDDGLPIVTRLDCETHRSIRQRIRPVGIVALATRRANDANRKNTDNDAWVLF